MQTFTAYKNHKGQAFKTPEACLHSEFDDLRETVIAWANALILLPSVDIEYQFECLYQKIEVWHEKGLEYHQILHEKKPHPFPQNLEEFREEYRETILKTGTDSS